MKLQVRDNKRDKRIVELYKKGLSYEDIGNLFGITKGRVGQLYRRIKKEKSIKSTNKRSLGRVA